MERKAWSGLTEQLTTQRHTRVEFLRVYTPSLYPVKNKDVRGAVVRDEGGKGKQEEKLRKVSVSPAGECGFDPLAGAGASPGINATAYRETGKSAKNRQLW